MEIKLFAIHTLGCKVNLFESNKIVNDLIDAGYTQVDFSNYANIYIINTCSVTGIADAKSKNYIRRPKRINPNAIVIVMGCYAQMNPNDATDLNVDIWIGNKYKNEIIKLINEYKLSNLKIRKIDNLLLENEFESNKDYSFKNNTRAFIKIQDGCNYMCSYCVIPYSRGRQRSDLLENIILEINKLVLFGIKEIVLTGINTAGYYDKNKNDFYDLLFAINNIKGDFRIRISSIEPFQINNKIINLITSNHSRFCQHWHICLQSGSDKILKQMNRKYSTNDFKKIINNILSKSPNTIFTTDYIVGFPTETDDDHNISKNFLKEIKFFKIHLFPYSKRINTPAARLKEINGKTKKNRFFEIQQLDLEIRNKILELFLDKEIEVIFEVYDDKNKSYFGYSNEYLPVIKYSDVPLKGQIIKVKVIKILGENLIVI
ncbi:MAG: tRNA (N(6)-L-threonylcarbamoyladenosine(37)-C(2))-methylthiotransferase MtaB [Mycoplasmoidaceae bacterium]